MRPILASELKEAVNHKDFIASLVENLNWQKEEKDEFGNLVRIVKGDVQAAQVRAAVALGLIPIAAISTDVCEFADVLQGTALRYREIFTGESAIENQEKLDQIKEKNRRFFESEFPPAGNEETGGDSKPDGQTGDTGGDETGEKTPDTPPTTDNLQPPAEQSEGAKTE